MTRDVFALVLAILLGAVVVVVGSRRKLSETTRDGVPQFGSASATAIQAVDGESWSRRKPLSRRQTLWMAALYLAMALGYATFAVLSANGRVPHAIFAATFAIGVPVFYLRQARDRARAITGRPEA